MRKNIVIAVLSCLFCAWIASAQVTTIPVKVQFTWNNCTASDTAGNCTAYPPLTGLNFIGQQLMSLDYDTFTHDVIRQNWSQFCNAALDATGTASCNFVYDPTGTTIYRFQLLNMSNATPLCDTSSTPRCFEQFDLSTKMIAQATVLQTTVPIKVRFSTANNTIDIPLSIHTQGI